MIPDHLPLPSSQDPVSKSGQTRVEELLYLLTAFPKPDLQSIPVRHFPVALKSSVCLRAENLND